MLAVVVKLKMFHYYSLVSCHTLVTTMNYTKAHKTNDYKFIRK
jgi:hypothetical protein